MTSNRNPPRDPSKDRRLARNGGVLVLASTALVLMIGLWEDGGKTGDQAVYVDKLAGNLPTACKGITRFTSPEPVVVGDIWSEERCNRVLSQIATNTQYGLLDCIAAPMSQNTFDALTDHAHNFGVHATCTSRAAGLIDAGRLEEGCNALSTRPDGSPAWSYVGTRFYAGLQRRRKAETALCLTLDSRPIAPEVAAELAEPLPVITLPASPTVVPLAPEAAAPVAAAPVALAPPAAPDEAPFYVRWWRRLSGGGA